jgi:hypothetical protein
MVQKTFGIYGETMAACQLTIEAGRDHVACLQKESETGKVVGLELFQFDKKAPEEFARQFNNIKQQSKLLHLPFADVQIVWANNECICVPTELYDEKLGDGHLNLMFGNEQYSVTKKAETGDMIMLYRMPGYQYYLLHDNFSAATSTHKYSLMLQEWTKRETEADAMQLLFYRSHFILMAMKEKKLQLINSFLYQTPEDAVYHILNVCARLELEKEQVAFYFSGLLDVQSNLYKELSLYLLNIYFLSPPPETLAAAGFGEYPAHYFSSFVNSYT